MVDLAAVSQGATSAAALAETTECARHAERLGYVRFWVAEHHNMPTVASTSPPVLMAHLAANTTTIRVGSGGVMLPNHAPLVVAEQFAMLEALHPGRIDVGIGRAPGTDRHTMAALRRRDHPEQVDEFPRDLIELMGLLGDVRAREGAWNHLSATPVATSSPEVLLLGSSHFSAQLAGMLGLAYAYANHFDMGGTLEAVDVYRAHFEPSDVLDAPYAIVSAAVICADDDDMAAELAAPARLRKFAMRHGAFIPLVEPAEALAHPQWAQAEVMSSNSIVGSPATVAAGLAQLAAASSADEIMVNTATFALTERLRSLELTAQAWAASPG